MNTKTSITTKTHSTSVDGVNANTKIIANITEINTRIVKLNGGVMRIKHKAPQRKEYKLQITQHLPDWGSNPLNDDYEYENVIVIGNDSCGARNVSEYAELYDRIVEHAIVGDMDYMILNYNRNGYKNVSEVIEDYLWVKPNKYQTGKVKKCFEKRYGEPDSHYYDEDLIADLLTLFTPHAWTSRGIAGCVQREWARVVYPTDIYNDKDIDRFEAFYFGLYMDYEAEYRGDSEWFTFCGFEDEDYILNEIASAFGTKNISYHPYY